MVPVIGFCCGLIKMFLQYVRFKGVTAAVNFLGYTTSSSVLAAQYHDPSSSFCVSSSRMNDLYNPPRRLSAEDLNSTSLESYALSFPIISSATYLFFQAFRLKS